MKLLVAFHVSSRILGLLQNGARNKKGFFCNWSTSKTAQKSSLRGDFGKFNWHPSCFLVCDDSGALFYACQVKLLCQVSEEQMHKYHWDKASEEPNPEPTKNLMNFSNSWVSLVTNSEAKLPVYISLHLFKKNKPKAKHQPSRPLVLLANGSLPATILEPRGDKHKN